MKYRATVAVLLLALTVTVAAPANSAEAALAKPSISLSKRTKKKAVIKIKKQSGVTGYQIYLKTSKKGKFQLFAGIREQTYTLKNLKAKGTYYVKVRPFKTKGISISYGKYSKVLKIGPYKKQSSNSNSNISTDTSKYAQRVLELVNEERAKVGLDPLEADSTLDEAADIRVKELVTSFSHTRPNGTDPFTVLDELGYSYSAAGENIAAGQSSPAAVVESWMNSEGHRANILSPDYTKLGVGYCKASDIYGHYWVQLFSN